MLACCAVWDGPDLVMGDFNAIPCEAELFGGRPNLVEMEEFDGFIDHSDLWSCELKVVGLPGLASC